MKELTMIKIYNSNLEVFYTEDGEEGNNMIDFGGQAGIFTREEWKEGFIEQFNEYDQNEILDALERTGNISFFNEEVKNNG